MKTITKTFYVSDENLQKIKTDIGLIGIFENKNSLDKNQIQISWQEPEKKIEITESEFENVLESLKEKTQWRSYLDIIEKELKQKLFGASDENK